MPVNQSIQHVKITFAEGSGAAFGQIEYYGEVPTVTEEAFQGGTMHHIKFPVGVGWGDFSSIPAPIITTDTVNLPT